MDKEPHKHGNNKKKQRRDSWSGESLDVSPGLPPAKAHASCGGRGPTGPTAGGRAYPQ